MRLRKLISACALSLVALLAGTASAQTTTTGAIQGSVTEDASGVPMLLVTVVASSPALQGTQSEFTDAAGQYFMSNLPPGTYSLLFIYGDSKVKRDNVEVGLGKVTVANAKINTQATEVITVHEKAPTIDAGSTKQGTTIQQDYLKNVPNAGRTWAGVLQAAAGSQGDALGTSFSGSTSIENNYVVDGLNTSGVTLGQGFPTQGSQVLNNFISEIEVITGGYNAEFGRSTGGVVNVITKTGSNEFHGSVFANVNAFNAKPDHLAVVGSPLRGESDIPTQTDFGFDLGGPIIKDKLWFYVGFAPVITRSDLTRIVSTAIDRGKNGFNYHSTTCAKNTDGTCDGDGDPNTTAAVGCELTRNCEGDKKIDVDPATNNQLYEEISRSKFTNRSNTYQFTGKLNFAVTPEHQGQITFTGQPSTSQFAGVYGTLTGTGGNETELNTDLGFKWTSKFFDNKTQVDLILGWHRYKQNVDPLVSELPNDPDHRDPAKISGVRIRSGFSLYDVAVNQDRSEAPEVAKFCKDDATGALDQFPKITNCSLTPLGTTGYTMMSPVTLGDTLEQRMSAKATLTQRVKLAGHHQFKVGADFESNLLDDVRGYTGGSFIRTSLGGWRFSRYVKADNTGPDVCGFNKDKSPVACTYRDQPFFEHGNTWNVGGFVQDSWSILPNLTVNAGLRYEQQYLAFAESLRSITDPLSYNSHLDPTGMTAKPIGTNAMELKDLWAPRVGLVYDWTKEGRSKVYANWGRFYESIPMDINNRGFAGEVTLDTWYKMSDCGSPWAGDNHPNFASNPYNCPRDGTYAQLNALAGAGGKPSLVGTNPDANFGIPAQISEMPAPGIKPQYLDEFVAGVEYEVLEDLRMGLSFQNRRIGRVIEDYSTDGAASYWIGNPGEWDQDTDNQIVNQIKQYRAADPMDPRITMLENRLNAFRQITRLDKPIRDYTAVQLTAAKRFSRNFMMQGSYTWSRLYGNYPGLFSTERTQTDPNITSQYDLFELLPNRVGLLGFDRTHSFKLDGYYTFDLQEAGALTLGARLRAQSGTPYTALGAATNPQYGANESFLLPRASFDRTDFQFNADLHVAYAKKLGATELNVYFELFNLFNTQETAIIDQGYTVDAADPVVGGDKSDLPYIKPTTSNTLGPNGLTPAAKRAMWPVVKSLDFGQPSSKMAPLSARIGVGLSF
jgi:outer membrane receptor protein involved in Fe transport